MQIITLSVNQLQSCVATYCNECHKMSLSTSLLNTLKAKVHSHSGKKHKSVYFIMVRKILKNLLSPQLLLLVLTQKNHC